MNKQPKKIIALACSPSRGRNSDTMLDSFIVGVKKYAGENVIVDKIYLDEVKIEHYRYENSKGPQKGEEKFADLTKKMSVYDGLIISTPTYNFSVPAHLKNFLDRIRFVALDLKTKDFFGQPQGLLKNLHCYFLISGGTPVWAQKILFFAFPAFWLRAVFLYFGAKVFDAFYTGDVQSFSNKKFQKKCENKGIKYAKMILSEKGNGILEKLFWKPSQKQADL